MSKEAREYGMSRKVNLHDISRIVEAIVNHTVAKRESPEVMLRQNLYWNLPSPDVYKVTADAPLPDVGSLYDDWDFIREIATGEQEPLANNLTKMTQLMRYLGEVLGDELADEGG